MVNSSAGLPIHCGFLATAATNIYSDSGTIFFRNNDIVGTVTDNHSQGYLVPEMPNVFACVALWYGWQVWRM